MNGEVISAYTDGRWTITLGQFGVFGFVAEFGLLALTVFRAASALRLVESERDRIFLAAIALIVAITMLDMLPDAALTPLTWLFAGHCWDEQRTCVEPLPSGEKTIDRIQ